MSARFDLFVIGGGVNGTGIARDAAGRGLSVCLCEMGDLASATSSASTKLFHGGLRYLDYWEFRLVRESLIERERLLAAMPHISRPMRFVLPFDPEMRFESETPTSRLLSLSMPWMKGRRPGWLIRSGLFLYDHLGGRRLLPGTSVTDLRNAPEGVPLQGKFRKAWEYSDGWVDDARLVVLNARDAAARGAVIRTRARVTAAERQADHWRLLIDGGEAVEARAVVNAAGPWVEQVLKQSLSVTTREHVRLVRGSHIVVPRLYAHEKCYFFQGPDGRIIFAIPYESDFTLIGTTDIVHSGPDVPPECSPEEQAYLCDFASRYFAVPVTRDSIVWTYSGVRPLYDDGASSATAATRDYVLSLDTAAAPVLSVFGGKITTYRRLSEHALQKLRPLIGGTGDWTAGVPLPGGDFPVEGRPALESDLRARYPFLTAGWAARLVRCYGTDARSVLGAATAAADLGRDFGATLTEAEVRWQMDREFARTAADVVWRRTKLGLRLTADQVAALDGWMQTRGGADDPYPVARSGHDLDPDHRL